MTTVAERIDELAPIGLDDLVAESALLTRIDRKYILPRAVAEQLVAGLDAGTRVLEIDGRRAFDYDTVYFDTPDLLSWRLAAHSRRRRFKVRTRLYCDSATAYLEVKTRGARGATVKERIDYPIEARDRLTDEGFEYAEESLTPLGLEPIDVTELIPTLVSRYRRTTFAPPGTGLRATLDTELSWETPDGRQLRLPATAIVETKSGAQTSSIDRALWRAGHRPVGISKYGTGLAAIREDLVANKWTRVLRQHFGQEGGARCAA
ncbi:MAG TPA: polyphosphate polymerase domain-containing protein [Microbacteriaceae bacterium]|nr:polyphosphate polymerase domain-containing protein [Microbacteriaceae bacterium]